MKLPTPAIAAVIALVLTAGTITLAVYATQWIAAQSFGAGTVRWITLSCWVVAFAVFLLLAIRRIRKKRSASRY